MESSELVITLTSKLFEPEDRRLNGHIIRLNKQNKDLRRLKTDGFLFGGEFYVPKGVTITIPGPGQAKPALDQRLNPEMEGFLKDKAQVELERQLIKQVLFTLVRPCNSDMDRRNALPEFLVTLIPELARYPRSNEPAYTIRGNDRALNQYEKILPKMEVYSAAGFLY